MVVDCDLRRAQLHQRLVAAARAGLHRLLREARAARRARPAHDASPTSSSLTAGPLPPNPPALLARKYLGDLLGTLRRHFDWVLVDSPPLASVTDALLLARHADHTVLVVQHNKVDKKLVKRSVAALRKVTPNLLGRRPQRRRRARAQLPLLLLPAAGRRRAEDAGRRRPAPEPRAGSPRESERGMGIGRWRTADRDDGPGPLRRLGPAGPAARPRARPARPPAPHPRRDRDRRRSRGATGAVERAELPAKDAWRRLATATGCAPATRLRTGEDARRRVSSSRGWR